MISGFGAFHSAATALPKVINDLYEQLMQVVFAILLDLRPVVATDVQAALARNLGVLFDSLVSRQKIMHSYFCQL